ncbi:serine hydroxymethyltransferase [Fodinicurvata fenggangensis]|uniref:serine hydroxymethyltransferase n=1 Tax=Fodinicurvata fenggangensis TaxID=1121830 RepID=UPI00047EF514|nr:aminotransferase class I/II-fold pyridoxal phosphate-dependent enzyme [Fodinicurvata fenggangensis]
MLERRSWVPEDCEDYIQGLAQDYAERTSDVLEGELHALVRRNRIIHEADCINLNPATNAMNPRAEALLSQGLGSRPSLGYPGDKYEMGLEAIEKIEIMTAELASQVFEARYAEIRVPSGAIANLYAFMAMTQPGDSIIAPPETLGGHVTHHKDGSAGLYGVVTHPAPVDASGYGVELDGLRELAVRVRPKVITVGSSLNLFPHPISEIRAIADEVGAWVLFDAAHMSGMIAGRAWQQPLKEGAHIMTLSTYKSLAGPPSGMILTNEPELARRIDSIAFPGLTANFDAAKAAALAMTLLDWKDHGRAYAAAMARVAQALARALVERDLPVFGLEKGITTSQQFALEAASLGGGQAAAKLLRQGNILSCGIGLPMDAVPGDMNGLRLGSPEIVRWGMTEHDTPQIADFIADILKQRRHAKTVAKEVSEFRRPFNKIHFAR